MLQLIHNSYTEYGSLSKYIDTRLFDSFGEQVDWGSLAVKKYVRYLYPRSSGSWQPPL